MVQRKQIQEALNAEQRADLSLRLADVPWAQNHLRLLLQMLDDQYSSHSRRPMQNFVAFPAYLSRKEWDELSRYSADWRAVCNIFVRVLMERLCCINPSEPTKKKVTAFALYMTLHHVQQEVGSFAFEEFKTTLREYVVNQFKGKRKGKKILAGMLRQRTSSSSCQRIQKILRKVTMIICITSSKSRVAL